MSDCPLIPARLDELLAGTLGGAEREGLARHLREPCDACVEVLAGVDGERILAALAGPAARLADAEEEAMFEGAWASAAATATAPSTPPAREAQAARYPTATATPVSIPTATATPVSIPTATATATRPPRPPRSDETFEGLLATLWRWLSAAPLRPAMAVAGLVVLAVPVALVLRSPPDDPYTGIKGVADGGADAPSAHLAALVAVERGGRPEVLRRAAEGEALAGGEVVLLRYRLSAPAHVEVLAAGGAGAGARRLRVSPGGAAGTPEPAGERELALDGEAVALVPEELGTPLVVALVACPGPVPADRAAALEAALPDVAQLRALAVGCGVDAIRLVRAGEGGR